MGYAVVHMMKIKAGAVGGFRATTGENTRPRRTPTLTQAGRKKIMTLFPVTTTGRQSRRSCRNT